MKLNKLIVSIALVSLSLVANDGSLDTTFNPGGNPPGTVTTNIGNVFDVAFSVVARNNGQIILGGITSNGPNSSFALVQYNPDGSVDNNFGTNGNGIVITTFASPDNSIIHSLLLQPNGKIVAGGDATIGGIEQFALARYTANGNLDTTFGIGGKQTNNIDSSDEALIASIVLQPNGSIVAGGEATFTSLSTVEFALARYTSSGNLDNSFGTNGTVRQAIDTIAEIFSIALQSNGQIIAGGVAGGLLNGSFTLVRYNSNGTPDTSFGTNGNGVVQTIIGPQSSIQSIVLQSDGRIIAGGVTNITGITQIALVRYNSNGSLDTTFGSGGIAIINVGNTDPAQNPLSSIVLQPNGKIISGGSANINGINQFILVRYNNDGSVDSGFGNNGIVLTNVGGGFSQLNSLFLQPNGKLVAGGGALVGADVDFAAARYNAFTPFKESAIAQAIRKKYCPTGALR